MEPATMLLSNLRRATPPPNAQEGYKRLLVMIEGARKESQCACDPRVTVQINDAGLHIDLAHDADCMALKAKT
jgi:hypothetical protein